MNQEKASQQRDVRDQKRLLIKFSADSGSLLKPLTTALVHLEREAAEEQEVFRERWDLH